MKQSIGKWPWFERHFSFDFPPSKLPDIIERLRGAIARLSCVALISDSTRIARLGDTWSIQENIGHLLILEPLWIGRLEDIVNGGTRLRDADLNNSSTFEAKFNELEISRVIADFTYQRTEFISELTKVPLAAGNQTALHPRLEIPMRAVDLAYFVAEHDDYHFARITEIQLQVEN